MLLSDSHHVSQAAFDLSQNSYRSVPWARINESTLSSFFVWSQRYEATVSLQTKRNKCIILEGNHKPASCIYVAIVTFSVAHFHLLRGTETLSHAASNGGHSTVKTPQHQTQAWFKLLWLLPAQIYNCKKQEPSQMV